jgi:hypothetical protein
MTHADTLDEIARDNDARDQDDKPLTDAEQAFGSCITGRPDGDWVEFAKVG